MTAIEARAVAEQANRIPPAILDQIRVAASRGAFTVEFKREDVQDWIMQLKFLGYEISYKDFWVDEPDELAQTVVVKW